LTQYAARPESVKIDKSCLDQRHWWHRIHTPASTLAPLLRDRQVLSGASRPSGNTQNFGCVRVASEPGVEKITAHWAEPKRASNVKSATLPLALLAELDPRSQLASSPARLLPPTQDESSGSGEEVKGQRDFQDAEGHQANTGQGGGSDLPESPQYAQDAPGFEEAISASSMPFLLYQALPPSHSTNTHDYYFSNQEEGSEVEAQRRWSLSSVHSVHAAAEQSARRAAAGRQRSKTAHAGLGDQGKERGSESGRDIAWEAGRQRVPFGSGGPAHEWADKFDFAPTQHRTSLNEVLTPYPPRVGRPRSHLLSGACLSDVFGGARADLQVRGTLSDFKSQLSRGQSRSLPSRANSSLGWLEGGGRDIRQSTAGFTSDHAFSYGVESGTLGTHPHRYGSSRGPRTPRASSRFRVSSSSASGSQGGPGMGPGADLPRLGFASSLHSQVGAEWARVRS
jgi:hypothetical protein